MKSVLALTLVIASLWLGYNVFAKGDSPLRALRGLSPLSESVKITVLGDMMLDRGVAAQIKKTGFEKMFTAFRDGAKFETSDLVIANLEGNFAAKRIKTSKTIAFRFDPLLASELKWLGIDAVSLANNHILDMGKKGFTDTQKTLEDNEVYFFGTAASAERASWYTVTAGNKKVALVGFNTTFGALPNKDVKATMKEARASADIVLVIVHWGNEYKTKHAISQETFAKLLIDNGADAVVGMHPHVIQDIGVYKTKPIFYSLGNFVFDQDFSKPTTRGMAVDLEFASTGAITHKERFFKITKGEPTWE
ncbi:MAG: CapA family protein [bacterium]